MIEDRRKDYFDASKYPIIYTIILRFKQLELTDLLARRFSQLK
jgi:hypothetical protein